MDAEAGNSATSNPGSPGELLVFIVRRETECGECGRELGRGSFIFLKRDKGALCLSCADLDHLEFLPRGDAALTRRARKYSPLNAKVLQWSRTREQYERQGVLVERAAVERAMAECEADSDARKARQACEAVRRAQLDQQYIAEFTCQINRHFPGCPAGEAAGIAERACEKYSGRVGRSAMAKRLDEEAIFLAVQAHVRHAHTRYDSLMMRSWERGAARFEVQGKVDEILDRWRDPRRS